LFQQLACVRRLALEVDVYGAQAVDRLLRHGKLTGMRLTQKQTGARCRFAAVQPHSLVYFIGYEVCLLCLPIVNIGKGTTNDKGRDVGEGGHLTICVESNRKFEANEQILLQSGNKTRPSSHKAEPIT
jgi:hypothetical protein